MCKIQIVNRIFLPFYLFLLLLVFSCEDIINEENLENDQVELIAPSNNSILSAGENVFFWEDVEGATSYRIQIAEPDFNNPAQIIHDVIVQDSLGTSASLNIPIGSYQWRVRAQNGAFNSPYFSSNFTVN